ncbi:hypothetical protein Tco_0216781 [Tanacetum coccineum]
MYFQSSCFQWASIWNIRKLVPWEAIAVRRDISPFRVDCPEFLLHLFRFGCWAVFSVIHSFHVAPGDLISISESQSLKFPFHQSDYAFSPLERVRLAVHLICSYTKSLLSLGTTVLQLFVDPDHLMLANNLKVFSMLNAPWSTCDQKFHGGLSVPIDLSTTLLTTIAIDGS